MTSDFNTPQTPVVLDDDSSATPAELAEVKNETQALIEAIRAKAQVEAQQAGEFTREAYLSAVRRTRETVEQTKLFDPDKIEESINTIHKEAEKNWQTIAQEVQDFGDRLTEAAKTAWDILMGHDKDSTPKN
ncbi:MAG TPA: hypothetical protein V6D20_20940 [Candidatus Obscuribacterales bacterium]